MLILLLDDYFTRGLMPLVLSWIVNSSTRVAPPMGMLTDGQVEDRHNTIKKALKISSHRQENVSKRLRGNEFHQKSYYVHNFSPQMPN